MDRVEDYNITNMMIYKNRIRVDENGFLVFKDDENVPTNKDVTLTEKQYKLLKESDYMIDKIAGLVVEYENGEIDDRDLAEEISSLLF